MSKEWFEHAADALVNFLPPSYRAHDAMVTGRNLKVWFGGDGREHYEVQLIPARLARAKGRHVLEIGFHAEHPVPARNDEALARLIASERAWRRALGADAVGGPFLGRAGWTRVSETWLDAIDGLEAATDAAERLAAYITALEPLRARAAPRSRTAARRPGSARRSGA